MAYTTIDDPSVYFQTLTYSGTASTNAVTGVGFQPDWVWIKQQTGSTPHKIFDSVRGTSKSLKSNSTDAEATNEENGYLSAFGSDGFTVTEGSTSSDDVNASSGSKYVAWNWKAGTSFSNDASSTGVGSIDSAGSVNTDAGFSIIAWNGNDGTIAHGLGVKPAMIIIKSRQTGNNWVVFHKGLGTMSASSDSILVLNSTAAKDDPGAGFSEPTTSVFTIKGGAAANDNNIGYVFAEKQGYSKFGSYTGNGNADGTFVYTGFKPAFVMVKPASRTGRWRIKDNKRDIDNVMDKRLSAESSDGEGTGATEYIDFLSNGFKARSSEGQWNGSGETNIYMAFAENPFVSSSGVPTTAR